MIRTKQQKGSMMIEVVAVVALLALLTPLLFRQIQRRTEEVDNVRIATLMREAKDALGRAMEDNLSLIYQLHNGNADECFTWSNAVGAGAPHDAGDPRNYASVSNFDANGDLEFYVCHHVINLGGGNADKHVYHGIVFDTVDQDLPFLAAADIATMIGTEGGVCTDNNNTVTGVRSVWRITDGVFPCNGNPLVASLSSMVGLSPDGGITNLSINDFISPNGSVQTNIGYFGADAAGNGGWVHADTGLTVGTNCINPQWDPAAGYDANCQPIFEVTLDENGDGVEDDPAVVLGQNVRLIFEDPNETTYQAPVAGTTPDALTRNQVLASETFDAPSDAENPDSGFTPTDTRQFVIDPSGDSVMNDIRLTSRGNARLSQLLPTYILKGMLGCFDKQNSRVGDIWDFDCPPYHRKAVIIGDYDRPDGLVSSEFPFEDAAGHYVRCDKHLSGNYRLYQYCVFSP